MIAHAGERLRQCSRRGEAAAAIRGPIKIKTSTIQSRSVSKGRRRRTTVCIRGRAGRLQPQPDRHSAREPILLPERQQLVKSLRLIQMLDKVTRYLSRQYIRRRLADGAPSYPILLD
jgi:hypothetical protein